MRRSLMFSVLGTLALTAASLSAQTATAAKPATKTTTSTAAKPAMATTTKAKAAWATGQILRVDQVARTLVIKQGTHEMTFALAMDAQLMQGKKSLQTSDLSGDVGHQVKVRYTAAGDKRTADRIEVSEAAAKVAAKKP